MTMATVGDLKQWLADDPGTMDDYEDTLEELLEEAWELMEMQSGRYLATENDATRYARVVAGRIPVWDVSVDASEGVVPTVMIDLDDDEVCETALTYETDWQDWPQFLAYRGGEDLPSYFDRVDTSAVAWPAGALVEITGTVGRSTNGRTPRVFWVAQLLMAARLWQRRQALLGLAKLDEGAAGDVVSASDPDYEAIVRSMMHPHLLAPV